MAELMSKMVGNHGRESVLNISHNSVTFRSTHWVPGVLIRHFRDYLTYLRIFHDPVVSDCFAEVKNDSES